MIQAKRAVAVAFVSVLSLTLADCGKGNPFEQPILSPAQVPLPTSEEISIRIEPAEISFTHKVGENPCPQFVGRVTIQNVGSAPFKTDLRSQIPAPLSFGEDQTVPPGGSVTIDVFFTCASQLDFTTTVDALPPQAGRDTNSPNSQFTVRGTIVR